MSFASHGSSKTFFWYNKFFGWPRKIEYKKVESEIKESIKDLDFTAAKKIIKKEIDEKTHKRIIEETLDEGIKNQFK